jgi:uncharacterized RDD family membrane protein YckC
MQNHRKASGGTVSEQKEKNYYEMLGISFYASADDIRRAVEGAIRRVEGLGIDPGDPSAAAALAAQKRPFMQAYMTLKDPERRRLYNASLTAKISEAARVASEAKAFATGAHAGNATVGATLPGNPGVVIGANATNNQTSSAPAALGAHESVASPAPKYEAVDLRSSIQQRLKEGEMLPSRERDSLDEPAHLGVRFVAMLIDSAILTSFFFAAIFVLVLKGSASSLSVGFTLLIWLVPLLYYGLCESGKHRSTWGKRWMGLCVYRSDGETPVGFLRAAGRYVLRMVSSILMLGYIIAFFSERKQALHDLASDTVVYQAEDPPAYWILAGIVSVVIVPVALMFLLTKTIGSALNKVGGGYAQLLKDERNDPNRASPSVEEVQLAFRTGLSMQRVLKDYYAVNKRWPQPALRDQLIDQSARPQLLRDHNATLLPEGAFALSLGATAKGTARMIFQPDADGGDVEWDCVPVKIARDAQIAQCRR